MSDRWPSNFGSRMPNHKEIKDDKPQHSKFAPVMELGSDSATVSKTIKTSVEEPFEAIKLTDENMKLLVENALKQLESITKSKTNIDGLNEEIRQLNETMKSYLNQSSVIDQDIADMYIDIHYIFQKLERIDAIKLEKSKHQLLNQKLRNSEELKKRNRHHINNHIEKMEFPVRVEFQNPPDKAFSIAPKQAVECAEKRTFIRKSDYSIQLNREKIYFSEVEKVLNNEGTMKVDKDTKTKSNENESD